MHLIADYLNVKKPRHCAVPGLFHIKGLVAENRTDCFAPLAMTDFLVDDVEQAAPADFVPEVGVRVDG